MIDQAIGIIKRHRFAMRAELETMKREIDAKKRAESRGMTDDEFMAIGALQEAINDLSEHLKDWE